MFFLVYIISSLDLDGSAIKCHCATGAGSDAHMMLGKSEAPVVSTVRMIRCSVELGMGVNHP